MIEMANLQRKKRYSRWRAIALVSVYLLMGFHIVHWKIYGNTLAPLELNEVLYTLHLGIITAGFIFMGVTILGTLFFGRFFCSWACHILALQDCSSWILEKAGIRPKRVPSRAFFLVPVVAMLYLFIWPQLNRIFQGLSFKGFRLQTDSQGWASFITNDFWRNLPGIPITLLTFFICGFVIIYLLGSRSFCQMVCPYGVIFSFADKFAPGKIKLTGNCNQCGICTAHCSSHIMVHKEIHQFGKVVNSSCLKDLDCVAVCPNDAIKFGFTRPSLMQSFRKLLNHQVKRPFTVSEEILTGVLIFTFTVIYRGLYDTIPFLLAITLAVIFSYFSVLFFRIIKGEFAGIGSLRLKQGGRVTTAGKCFIVLFIAVFLFSLHSAYIHFHTYMGERYYQKMLQPGQTFLSGTDHPDQQHLLASSELHLEKAARWGVFLPASLLRELASVYLLKNDEASAERYLVKMLDADCGDEEARLRLVRIMVRSGRHKEAMVQLQRIMDTEGETGRRDFAGQRSESHLIYAREEDKRGNSTSAIFHLLKALYEYPENAEAALTLGIIYARNGRFADAKRYLLACYETMQGSPVLHHTLGLVYTRTGNPDSAIVHLKKLIVLQPRNAQAQVNLGMLLYRTGKTEEALQTLKLAQAQDPGNQKTIQALSMITENKKKTEVTPVSNNKKYRINS